MQCPPGASVPWSAWALDRDVQEAAVCRRTSTRPCAREHDGNRRALGVKHWRSSACDSDLCHAGARWCASPHATCHAMACAVPLLQTTPGYQEAVEHQKRNCQRKACKMRNWTPRPVGPIGLGNISSEVCYDVICGRAPFLTHGRCGKDGVHKCLKNDVMTMMRVGPVWKRNPRAYYSGALRGARCVPLQPITSSNTACATTFHDKWQSPKPL